MYRNPVIGSQTYVNGVRVIRISGVQVGFATIEDNGATVGSGRIFFGTIAIETPFVDAGFLNLYFSSGYSTSLELPAV
jgi:hypothetical protein